TGEGHGRGRGAGHLRHRYGARLGAPGGPSISTAARHPAIDRPLPSAFLVRDSRGAGRGGVREARAAGLPPGDGRVELQLFRAARRHHVPAPMPRSEVSLRRGLVVIPELRELLIRERAPFELTGPRLAPPPDPAAPGHVAFWHLARVVIVRDGDWYAMTVLPASAGLDLSQLLRRIGRYGLARRHAAVWTSVRGPRLSRSRIRRGGRDRVRERPGPRRDQHADGRVRAGRAAGHRAARARGVR